MFSVFFAFVGVALPGVYRCQATDLGELSQLFGDQRQDHEDDADDQHLAVDSARVDVSVPDGGDGDYHEVHHVMESVHFLRVQFLRIRQWLPVTALQLHFSYSVT